MKINLLIASLAIISLLHPCYAQVIPTRPNAVDGEGLKTGNWVYYYNKYHVKIEKRDSVAFYRLIAYEKGEPIGKFKDYYLNGKLQSEGFLYSEDPQQFDGEVIYYSEAANITNVEFHLEGVLDNEKSIALLEKVVEEHEKNIPNHPDYATSLHNLAFLYKNMGRYAAAEPLFQQALEIRKDVLGENHPDYAQSLDNLANIKTDIERYAEAELLYLQALKIRKDVLGENHPDYAECLNNLGYLNMIMVRYVEAEPLFQQALKIQKDVLGENHPDYANSVNLLANLYRNMGRYAEAELLFQQALKIRKEKLGEDHYDYGTSLSNLASLFQIMGRYAVAEPLYLQALKIIKAMVAENHPDYAATLNKLANLYQSMGRYAEAEPLYRQALKTFKETMGENSTLYAECLQRLANIYKSMGRYSEAEPLYQQASKTFKETMGENAPSYSSSLFRMAQLYQAMDTLPKIALANYENAHAVNMNALGKNHPRVAEIKAAQATFHYYHGEWVPALSLFTIHLDFQQNYLQQYFDYLGEAEREALYKTVKDNFEQFAELSFREYKTHPELLATTYNLQLRYKALLLNTSNQVKKRILASGDRQLISLYDETQALKQLLGQTASLSDNELLLQRRVKRDSLKQTLATKDQQLTQFSGFYAGENKQPDWQDIRARLGKNEAAVEVIRFRTYDYRRQEFTKTVKYAALIITAKTTEQPEVVFFGDGTYLENKAISFYRNSIQAQLPDEESYKNFWKPLQSKLKKIEKVYFSPDGVFHSLNMEALYNRETGKYLRDEITLELVTSGKDLLQVKQAPLPQKLGLLIGNPAFGGKADVASGERNTVFNNLLASVERGSGVSPLPGTEKEVQQIQSLLKANKWRETTLLNADAKEEILKDMLKPNVLHIATHGFFQGDVDGEIKYNTNPLYRSGILLSGAAETLESKADLRGNIQMGKEDGILTAFEALNLNIDNTDLVVLSACETGLGEIRNGEGVFGLQRAFKLAGARTILMSLWKVNDQTTQELMVSFYENWLGGMSKRAAFDKAQTQLKTKYPHPYYWGAFVLIGD